jgi:hypothetical protein
MIYNAALDSIIIQAKLLYLELVFLPLNNRESS